MPIAPLQQQLRKPSRPIEAVSVWVEVSEACQFKCRFCYNYWRDVPPNQHDHMSNETVAQLAGFLQRFAEDGFRVSVALAGGDATTHPAFLDIVQVCAPLVHDLCLVTHGGELAAPHLHRLSTVDNASIQFSIPSLTLETYRFLTGGRDYLRTLTALAQCELFAIPRSISVVLNTRNRGDLSSLIELAAETGSDYLLLNRFIAAGRAKHYSHDFSLSEDEFKQAISLAAPVARKWGVDLRVSGIEGGRRLAKVRETKITVGVDGRVRHCSLAQGFFSTLDSTPDDVVACSRAFWTSTEIIEECVCSHDVGHRKAAL